MKSVWLLENEFFSWITLWFMRMVKMMMMMKEAKMVKYKSVDDGNEANDENGRTLFFPWNQTLLILHGNDERFDHFYVNPFLSLLFIIIIIEIIIFLLFLFFPLSHIIEFIKNKLSSCSLIFVSFFCLLFLFVVNAWIHDDDEQDKDVDEWMKIVSKPLINR